MPKAFDTCQKQGGKIRTKTLSGNKYMHICIDKQGKSHAGYVKTKGNSPRENYANLLKGR
jgi:hypothetical protein